MPHCKVARWFWIVFVIVSCTTTTPKDSVTPFAHTFPPEQRPKNIVLMIGDGMGLGQVSAALYSNNNRLSLEKFPVLGFIKTHSADDLITDSAAGATAFACGVKTYNGAVGLDADSVACRTILEEARDRGYATGIVVTTMFSHATPAAFYAHQNIRVLYEQIATDFIDSGVDFAVGGGKHYFDNREIDDRKLSEELRAKGYYVTDYMGGEFAHISANPKKKFVYFTADRDPTVAGNGRDFLPVATKRALQFLEQRSEKGFFLMVEGSQIDWACHHGKAEWLIPELLDFNKAIEAALDFARKDGNTLVIVTADHETGGLSINEGSRINKLKLGFTSNTHTAAMVPIFAYGPYAHTFSGIYDNTDVYRKMRQALGFGDSTSALNYR